MIAPELHRSAFRRTMAEVRGDEGNFGRIARREVKIHLKAAGPLWRGEEVKAGTEMCWLMVKQPGFVIVAVYTAWVYAHFTMILMVSMILFPSARLLLTKEIVAWGFGISLLHASPAIRGALRHLVGIWCSTGDALAEGFSLQPRKTLSTANR